MTGTALPRFGATIVLCAAMWAPGLSPANQENVEKEIVDLLIDQSPPEFESLDLEGNIVRLSKLRDRVVVINFWGIWCAACRQEMPLLMDLYQEHRNQGLEILGADYGDSSEDLLAYVQENDIPYPVLPDDGLADLFRVFAYPTTFVVDRGGRIRYRVEGFRPEDFRVLRRVVEYMLRAGRSSPQP